MNILILSAGTRNKVVQYFKRNLGEKGKVVATDMSEFAPAVYEADKFYKVPCISDKNYLNIILDLCAKEKINGVLSLIDPELSLLADNTDKFEKIGVKVIGSPSELCERALDKIKMFNWLSEHGYYCARSYDNLNDFYLELEEGTIQFPVFVKPVKGSASVAINKVYDKSTLEFLFNQTSGLMIQEYLNGQEIGADCYVDMITGKPVSVFTKKKLLMRAGETDKAVSFKDEKLFELIQKFVVESGWIGQIDIDIFKIDDKYYISEVNPRFGGGYPHAYESGCNHIRYIINNLEGKANTPCIGSYAEGIYMMKYNEVAIKKL